jgi:hypothetical protein
MSESDDPDQTYSPNMQKPGEGDPKGPACFQDQYRVCGPDCMAFLPKPPEGTEYLGEQWAHCLLLVNAQRVGKHSVIIANELVNIRKKNSQAQAEAIRSQKPPEPK